MRDTGIKAEPGLRGLVYLNQFLYINPNIGNSDKAIYQAEFGQCHSRESGNPDPDFAALLTWIPAFAGMTIRLQLFNWINS